MIVFSRFEVAEGSDFLDRARAALDALAACRGFVAGRVGRAADDPRFWGLYTEWESVGAFRRALSTFDVKVAAAPLMATSIEEPAAYEILVSVDASAPARVGTSDRAPDADTAHPG